MPTISSTPRSGTPAARGGRISSTPRSAYRSPLTGATPRGESGTAFIARQANLHQGAGPAFSPFGALLKAANISNLAIGDAIQHPSHIISGGPSFADLYSGRKGTSIGKALEQRGALDAIPNKYGLRTTAKFAADVTFDPTSWITLGGAAAARTAGRAATQEILQKAAAHEAITLSDVAKAAHAAEAARAAVPRALSVGIQLPFTRAKRLVLAESESIPRAVSKITSKAVPEGLRDASRRLVTENFAPAAGTDKLINTVGRKVDQFASSQKRQISREAARFDKELRGAIKDSGLSRYEGARLVTLAAERPEKWATKVPEALQPFVMRLRSTLDEFDTAEQIAGIEKGQVPDYVPHRLLNAAERRRFEREFAGTASLDSPFFVKERTFPHIEAGEAAGYKFEVNPARLLEVRGHASIDALAKKSFDDRIAAERGVIDVPDAPPSAWDDLAGGGVATEVESPALATARQGWSQYPSKYLKDVQVDPATRAAIMRVHEQIAPSIMTNSGLQQLNSFANLVTARWKALALGNPGFHLRNGFSDAVSGFWAGGRNPKSYVDAGRLLLGKAPKFSLKVDDVVLDGEGLISLARSMGAIDQGFGKEVAGGLAETAGSIRSATQKVRAPGTGGWSQANRRFGDFRENAGRLGTFIERLKAGDSPYEAARITNEFHMDYGGVGRFVAGARRFVMPFLTYSAKALPLVGRQVVRRPGTFATTGKAINALNEAGGNPDLSLLAPGNRSSFAVPLPGAVRGLLGAKEGDPILYNPEKVFSFGVLNTFDPTQIKAEGASLVSPFLRAGYELPTGYRLYYSGQAARRQRAPWAIQQAAQIPVLASLLDYGPKKYRYRNQTVPGYGSTADYMLRLFPPFSTSANLAPAEGAPSVAPSLGSWLTGIRLSPYDRQRDAYYAQLNKDRR